MEWFQQLKDPKPNGCCDIVRTYHDCLQEPSRNYCFAKMDIWLDFRSSGVVTVLLWAFAW